MYVPPAPKHVGPPNPADCKPTIRDEAKYRASEQFRRMLEDMQFDHLKTCLTCITFREFPTRIHANFVSPPGYCVKWDGTPPARIIAYGCDAYAHNDEIPF